MVCERATLSITGQPLRCRAWMLPCNALQLGGEPLRVTGAAAAVQVGNVAPLNVTQFFDGLVTIVDPAAFSDTSAKIRASVVGSVIAATGARPAAALGWLSRGSLDKQERKQCEMLYVDRDESHVDSRCETCNNRGIYPPC